MEQHDETGVHSGPFARQETENLVLQTHQGVESLEPPTLLLAHLSKFKLVVVRKEGDKARKGDLTSHGPTGIQRLWAGVNAHMRM